MRKIFFICTPVLFFACGKAKNTAIAPPTDSLKTDTTAANTNVILNDSVFHTEWGKSTLKFFVWYKENHDTLMQLQNDIVINDLEDETDNYKVDLDRADKYLNEFKKSGLVSEVYLKRWRDYFIQCKKYLKENPQNDGPAVGFEYDFVLYTQEISSTLDEIETPINFEEIETSPDHAQATIGIGQKLKVFLSKKSTWQVDSIENLGYEK